MEEMKHAKEEVEGGKKKVLTKMEVKINPYDNRITFSNLGN